MPVFELLAHVFANGCSAATERESAVQLENAYLVSITNPDVHINLDLERQPENLDRPSGV
jgi:hypothetical protein